jgi:hypothetical protein
MISPLLDRLVESEIQDYAHSQLATIFADSATEPYAIKFVSSQWALNYVTPKRMKISQTPALTWGTGTYVTPVAFPLSSVLYGRIGLVTPFDPRGWRVFDATRPSARAAYLRWARAQPIFPDLVLTVHSTTTNHTLRNEFRRRFRIDCVLFRPDQEAELHTDRSGHVWMLVTDWTSDREIDGTFSSRLDAARFTVLVDDEFDLLDSDHLPIQTSARRIEAATTTFAPNLGYPIARARVDPGLPRAIVDQYVAGGYVHAYVAP